MTLPNSPYPTGTTQYHGVSYTMIFSDSKEKTVFGTVILLPKGVEVYCIDGDGNEVDGSGLVGVSVPRYGFIWKEPSGKEGELPKQKKPLHNKAKAA